ncbi:acyltransferase family protein [Actinoplanes sp. GCM10030250]|uniref:acyltransferase family protein n=1 Tax=Actinoplanes sp. GCM10030250 TaxID=3273376 RepID=UPI00361C019C
MSSSTLTPVPSQPSSDPSSSSPAAPDKSGQVGRRGDRIVALDGLRFIAAFMVLLYHLAGRPTGGPSQAWGESVTEVFPQLQKVAQFGWLGVEMFFIISGFAICMSAWGRSLGDFFRSRVVRVYPAYWAAVLITFTVVSIWPMMRGPVRFNDMLLNLTMLHEPLGVTAMDGVYWTLWAELKFYLLFALVVAKGLTYRRVVTFCCAWTVAAVVAVSVDNPLLTEIVQPSAAPFFIAGIALYMVRRFGSDFTLWGIVGVSWLIAQHHAVYFPHGNVKKNVDTEQAIAITVFVTLVFVVIGAIAVGRLSWIRWRALTTAGLLTYPLYLLHQQIGWVLVYGLRRVLPTYVTLALVIAILLLAAYLVHRLVERPLSGRLRTALQHRPDPELDKTRR